MGISGLGLLPMAQIEASMLMRNSEPGTSTGRRRPESSGSPSSMRRHWISVSRLRSSPIRRTGRVRKSKTTPSSSAFSTSSARAGSSSRLRR